MPAMSLLEQRISNVILLLNKALTTSAVLVSFDIHRLFGRKQIEPCPLLSYLAVDQRALVREPPQS